MHLLILACSAAKRPGHGLLPAVERYDGPAYRLLRAYLRQRPGQAAALDMLILSAHFGLIAGDTPIPAYDQRMTTGRAAELRPQVRQALARRVGDHGPYQRTFVNLGHRYLAALELPPDADARLGKRTSAAGGIGVRLHQLTCWLESLSAG